MLHSTPLTCIDLLQGLLASVCESAAIVLFVVEIAMEVPEYMSILMMNGVFLIPICFQIRASVIQRSRGEPQGKVLGVLVAALLLSVLGLALTAYFVIKNDFFYLQMWKLWEIPVCLILLSIAWCPFVQVRQLYPNRDQLHKALVRKYRSVPKYHQLVQNQQEEEARRQFATDLASDADSRQTSSGRGSGYFTSVSMSSTNGDTNSSSSSPDSQTEQRIQLTLDDPLELIVSEPRYNARWKITIFTTFLKLLLIPGFALLFGYLFNIVNIPLLHTGFAEIHVSNNSFPSFLMSILASFGGYLVGWVACVMGMHKVAFVVPLSLATPLALGFRMLQDFCVIQIEPPCHPSDVTGERMYLTIPAALFLYVAQILSTGVFIYKTKSFIMLKESQVRCTEAVACFVYFCLFI